MSPDSGTCPVCGRTVRTRASDGRLREHGHTQGMTGSQCRGSGQPPAPAQTESEPRLHERRTQ